MDNTTAKVSCFARAYHFENNKTHIFADSMAARLLGDDYYLNERKHELYEEIFGDEFK
jgi:hypothetical protein